ncbi:hypothetical protein [Rhodobaculum claviforme]|uniref:Uncharacterized protein n=1 Tax=Rhodobaculum claviforme TaxID=1549854 RepID=A0A934TLJ6_9RHOB|nr:hypothetical protein [Rhodobaculum claviforme]MBK5928072.1 hypothetical protein [Rhodobaculum claviforme]
MSPEVAGGAVGLATLVARIGAEMDALAALAAALDAGIGATLDGGVARDACASVQDLDRLRQWASDLAMVQRRLADCVPADVAVPVDPLLVRLQLGALVQRLRTGTCDGADAAGGVEIF